MIGPLAALLQALGWAMMIAGVAQIRPALFGYGAAAAIVGRLLWILRGDSHG